MPERVSAAFENRDDAAKAIHWLQDSNVREESMTVVASNPYEEQPIGVGAAREDERSEGAESAKDMGKGAASGAAIGAGVGALFGLAAAAIPGVGPFITAGWLASALGTTAGGAAAGAVVGGTAGTLAGALTHWGLEKAEAEHYAREVESGKVYVGVTISPDSPVSADEVRSTFRRHNGKTSDDYR